MPIEVFDYHKDIKNVLIAPTVRGRFLRMEPGETGPRHSHDLGDELFLILDGRCRFEIEGEYATLGPGELCIARVNQRHQVWTDGDQPVTMFLTVTPHIEPTHTFWDDAGKKLPPVYGVSTRAERRAAPPDPRSIAALRDQFFDAARALAAAATEHASASERIGPRFDADPATARAALDDLWGSLASIYGPLREMEAVWNALAARVGGELDEPGA